MHRIGLGHHFGITGAVGQHRAIELFDNGPVVVTARAAGDLLFWRDNECVEVPDALVAHAEAQLIPGLFERDVHIWLRAHSDTAYCVAWAERDQAGLDCATHDAFARIGELFTQREPNEAISTVLVYGDGFDQVGLVLGNGIRNTGTKQDRYSFCHPWRLIGRALHLRRVVSYIGTPTTAVLTLPLHSSPLEWALVPFR